MANTKEIKNRIKSVQDTGKITNAMYLIASTKMRKAKSDLDRTRPYFAALHREIDRIFTSVKEADSKYFFNDEGVKPEDRPDAVLVITADKGLAGAYNLNVLRKAEDKLREAPDTRLFVVGEYGRQYFMKHNIPIEKSFLYTAQNPSMHRAREISEELLSLYADREVDSIFIIYTDLKNSVCEEAICTEVLPFHVSGMAAARGTVTESYPVADNGSGSEKKGYMEFVPSVSAVLDNLIQSYVSGFVYGALIDSFCCEQSARMAAMSAANDNAREILSSLQVQYNRVRQAAITQEITEVSSGAKAQIRKRKIAAGSQLSGNGGR